MIWLSGVGVFFLIRKASVRKIVTHPAWLSLGLLLTVGMLLTTRSGALGGGPGDLALGLACAILVAGLACTNSANSLYGKISAGMSDISYTLYLVHFPLMAFVFFVFFHGKQIVPNAVTSLWFVGLLSVAVRVFVESRIELFTDREPIPAGVGAPWLMPWMRAGRISTLGARSMALWHRICATGDWYLGTPWARALLRPGPALTYSSLYLILFMTVCDRC